MRLLTNSLTRKQGLETIQESELNDSQNVVFCVPINKNEAEEINSIRDLRKKLKGGIETKILNKGEIETVILKQRRPVFDKYFEFQTKIYNTKIRFYISKLNRNLEDNKFNIKHFYSGEINNSEFHDTKLLILEPNLNDLDELYLEHKVIFIDYNE
jgi:hypothetical protein